MEPSDGTSANLVSSQSPEVPLGAALQLSLMYIYHSIKKSFLSEICYKKQTSNFLETCISHFKIPTKLTLQLWRHWLITTSTRTWKWWSCIHRHHIQFFCCTRNHRPTFHSGITSGYHLNVSHHLHCSCLASGCHLSRCVNMSHGVLACKGLEALYHVRDGFLKL